MNQIEANATLEEIEKYLSVPRTKQEIDRACAIIDEIYQRHIQYLDDLIEKVAPDYIPMERE